MLKELFKDLLARKKYNDAFAKVYRTNERGMTLSEVLSDAEAVAIRLGKVKSEQSTPEQGGFY